MSDYKETKQLKHIVCQVEKILFRDDNTGRIIMSVVKNDGKHTRLLGKTSKVVVGSVLKATGSWSKDEKYGWQFNAEFIQVVSANPQADESEYLECNVKSIKVIKAETGFSIATVEGADGSSISLKQNSNIKLSGRLAKVRQGVRIGVYGKWKHDDRYGEELQVSAWEYTQNGEDNALKLAADFIKHLKPEVPASECANAEEENGEIQETAPVPTVFALDSDLSKRAEIQSITISDSIVTIEKETFVGCNNLTEIVVSEGNGNYASVEGVLFNKDMTELICFPSGKVGTYTIPDTVQTIADWAFCGCLGLTEIEIPESVSSIGEYSFAYCSGLEAIKFPQSLNLIRKKCFYCCFRLKSIILPQGTNMPKDALEGCLDISISVRSMIPWEKIAIDNHCLIVPGSFGEATDVILFEQARHYMTNALRRITAPLPMLEVTYKKGSNPIVENKWALHEVFDLIKNHLETHTIDIDWKDVSIHDTFAKIQLESGATLGIVNSEAKKYMDNILKRITISTPKIQVQYTEGVNPKIINEQVLDDVIAILKENRNVEIVDVSWKRVKVVDKKFLISIPSGKPIQLQHDEAKAFMDNIVKRLRSSLPKLKIRQEEGSRPVVINEEILDDVIKIIKENIIVGEVEIDWKDVQFADNAIRIKTSLGDWIRIPNPYAMSFMNKMLIRLAMYLPKLVVRFEEGVDPLIVNEDVLSDIITIMQTRKNYAELIRENRPDVLKALNVISKKDTRVFLPRDMSPYIKFLSERHAIDTYPIVPVEEYIGGSYEEGALFTIIRNGQPHIVWENFKDSRSTYVFVCTEDNYSERRQIIFDYITTEEDAKRRFLHTDYCKEIFGEKPEIILHNNMRSWAARLLKAEIDEELKQELEQYEGAALSSIFHELDNAKIIIRYLGDPELYFDPDGSKGYGSVESNDVDESGHYIDEYFEGNRIIVVERTLTVSKFGRFIDDGTSFTKTSNEEYRDEENYTRRIARRKQAPMSQDMRERYEQLCQKAVDALFPNDTSKSYNQEEDIRIDVFKEGKVIYSTYTCPSSDL